MPYLYIYLWYTCVCFGLYIFIHIICSFFLSWSFVRFSSFFSHWIIRLFYAEIRHKNRKFWNGFLLLCLICFFWLVSFSCLSPKKRKSKWQSYFISVPSNILAMLNNNQRINVACVRMTIATQWRMNQKKKKINARWREKATNKQYFKI